MPRKTEPTFDEKYGSGLSVDLAMIKTELKWIVIIGTFCITVGIGGFAYLIESEIPKQVTAASNSIAARFPDNFSDRFAKLEQKVTDMQSRYGGITPSSLKNLIPDTDQSPTPSSLLARLRRADKVIESSYDLDLPSDPQRLQSLYPRLEALSAKYGSYPQLAPAILSTQAHFVSYDKFSKAAYNTNLSLNSHSMVQTKPLNVPQYPDTSTDSPLDVIANLTLDCQYPTAGAIGGDPQSLSRVFTFQVKIETCQQRELGYITWVRTEFENSTIFYNGGPLT